MNRRIGVDPADINIALVLEREDLTAPFHRITIDMNNSGDFGYYTIIKSF